MQDNLFYFANGLPGFPQTKKFSLTSLEADSPFFLLESIEDQEISFIVVNPFFFYPDYEFEINDPLKSNLKITKEEDLLILNIVTLKKSLQESTVNLLAPLIFNLKERIGEQIILDERSYQIRTPLLANLPVRENG